MKSQAATNYWKSYAEREGGSVATDLRGQGDFAQVPSRRQFLEAAGFTLGLAAMTGCGRAPTTTALPLVEHPEGATPGLATVYASTCAGCTAACGLLVGVRDGRPLKMEGMPEHPLSRGGLCATGQALPLGLYDDRRLSQPLMMGKPASWQDVDQSLDQQLKELAATGGAVRFVTATVTSPTKQRAIDTFLQRFTNSRHVTFDAVSCSAIQDAHEITHGVRVLPHYQFDRAQVIVAIGADFLGTWISPVEFTAAWGSRRKPTVESPEMSYHVQLEGRMSLTGSKADQRYPLDPAEYGVLLSHLANRLAPLAAQPAPPGTLDASPIAEHDLVDLTQRLWSSRAASLVVCDSQEVSVQLLVNWINGILGNYGATLDIAQASRQKQGNDRELLGLIDELRAGEISALFVADTDFTQNLPDRDEIAAAIAKVPLVVSFAERENDFTTLAHFVCPDHHPLESWLDAEPVVGLYTLSQPTLFPLKSTRSILESLARWSGSEQSAYDQVRSLWEKTIWSRVGTPTFTQFWDQTLHDGYVLIPSATIQVGESQNTQVEFVRVPAARSAHTLVLYTKMSMTDSRHAHNPWLQELPDPITKVTWDNYVSVSPQVAAQLELTDGDVVRVAVDDDRVTVELPTLIQPGQHPRVIAIALGYGVPGTDRFARIGPQWLESKPTVAIGGRVGQNVAPLIGLTGTALQYVRTDVTLTKTQRRHQLASTQQHHTLSVPPNVAPHGAEVRDHVQETVLTAFAKNPAAGAPHSHHTASIPLWPADHPQDSHRWGMVIDLNACTGCSACLIACQSENNVPVVGKDEVARQREMHWLRIDRYYAGDDDRIQVAHQPMMCQHCENAPCETVCPVLATVHSDEGLNEQVYNRCVGTRYCANNCPYKVRRFNWFNYGQEDSLATLALNPDVTVRTRGVMEKCSLCVHRIEEGKIAARQRGEAMIDGSVQTACQQSCPARAIVFGDMNDPVSEVHAAWHNPRRYRVLEEFNFGSAIGYLRIVRNRDETSGEATDHA